MRKTTINSGIYSVDINDLIALGWYIDNDDVTNAMDINIEEAKEYIEKNYHVDITVNQDMTTLWRFVNTSKRMNGIDEGSDDESTGDDEETVKDILHLIEQGKVWNIKEF